MWTTSDGDRTLTGAEGELFRYGASSLLELLIEHRVEGGWSTGMRLFDRLQHSQRVALLRDVVRALLIENVPAPKLTAINESAVAAVYEHLLEEMRIIELENDDGGVEIRQRMLNALEEEFKEEGLELPDVACKDEEEWRWVTDTCMDRILWDRDFEDFEEMLDAPPERADVERAFLRIEDDYFTAIPPDVAEQRVEQYVLELGGILK